MKPHFPTSVMLEELLKEAPPDHVTLAWLTGSLRERSFGLVMLIMALAGLVPGASIFIGILLGFPAVQMILGRESPGLPRFITSRRVPTRRVVRLFHRAIPLLKRMEKLIRPRWRTPFETTKRIVGVVVLLLAATLVSPFPFSHIIPALVIMLISFAYLEEDGALLCITERGFCALAALSRNTSRLPRTGRERIGKSCRIRATGGSRRNLFSPRALFAHALPFQASSSQASAGQTILVVEPDVLVRMVIADYLRECGDGTDDPGHGCYGAASELNPIARIATALETSRIRRKA